MRRIAATVAAARRPPDRRRDLPGPDLRRGKPRSVLDFADDAFVISSFSKYFNMTGWRLGWVVAPERHVRDLEKLAQNLYISPAAPSQHAALACFEPETLAILESRRQAFEARRDYLVPALRDAGLRHSGHAHRRLLRLRRLLDVLATTASSSAATCSKARASRSRRAWTSAATAPREHVRFAYTIDAGEAGRRRRAPRPLPRDDMRTLRTCAGLAWRAARRLQRVRDGRLLLAGRVGPARHPLARQADRRGDRARRRRGARQRLARVQAIRAYASRELGVARQRSYTRYTDLGRPFVVWNVFATPELSLKARAVVLPGRRLRQLSRLFQRERGARRSGAAQGGGRRRVRQRRARVFDARLFRRSRCCRRSCAGRRPKSRAGVPRARAPGRLREGRHAVQRVVRGRRRGGRRRALARGAKATRSSTRSSTRSERLRVVFRDLVRDTRARLAAVYASDAPDADKRRAQGAAFAAMRDGYERAKAGEPGLAGYDRWFAGRRQRRARTTRASSSVALYTGQVPAFRALLAAGGRRPAAVLRAGEGTRRAAQARARRASLAAAARPTAVGASQAALTSR